MGVNESEKKELFIKFIGEYCSITPKNILERQVVGTPLEVFNFFMKEFEIDALEYIKETQKCKTLEICPYCGETNINYFNYKEHLYAQCLKDLTE